MWEQPTIEYGTCNGDGYFNQALDVTKVELKSDETVVYITARQRPGSERDNYWLQFAGDTYLKVGNQRYTLVSADAIERHLDVHSWPTYKLFNRDGNLLDLKVDARDLENLARLLEQMK